MAFFIRLVWHLFFSFTFCTSHENHAKNEIMIDAKNQSFVVQKAILKSKDYEIITADCISRTLQLRLFLGENSKLSLIWVFPKIGGFTPKSSICSWGFPLFSPSILGGKHPYFWFNIHMCKLILSKLSRLQVDHWILTNATSRDTDQLITSFVGWMGG